MWTESSKKKVFSWKNLTPIDGQTRKRLQDKLQVATNECEKIDIYLLPEKSEFFTYVNYVFFGFFLGAQRRGKK